MERKCKEEVTDEAKKVKMKRKVTEEKKIQTIKWKKKKGISIMIEEMS